MSGAASDGRSAVPRVLDAAVDLVVDAADDEVEHRKVHWFHRPHVDAVSVGSAEPGREQLHDVLAAGRQFRDGRQFHVQCALRRARP